MSSCSRLTASGLVMIDRLRFREHRTVRQIAEAIGRGPSTVSRELRRNLWNPSNENRDGMIRRCLPKGTSLGDLAQDELDEITRRINGTPLKVLGWLTPAETWDEQMGRFAVQGATVPGYPVQSTPTHGPRRCCTSN